MSSTTIRYSGVPENSHSRGTDSGHDEPIDHPIGDANSASDLTLRWRSRLREELAARNAAPAPRAEAAAAAAAADKPDQNPGLLEQPDGYYDWADRRLFLSDGSPDPLTPGAYRYQTRPDLCDLDAPETDPNSPRYEPDHLRHKPGDTWIIDKARPYDVLDPGPFGSPGWFPDRRTGRHRRDELPDPIPWWEVEEEPEKAEWAEQAEALWLRRTNSGSISKASREGERRESAGRGGPKNPIDPPGPPGPPGGSGTTSPGYPEEPQDGNARTRRWNAPASDRSQSGSSGSRARGANEAAASARAPDYATSAAPEHDSSPRYNPQDVFEKLREDAWARFIEKSASLAAAHHPVNQSARSNVQELSTGHRSERSGSRSWSHFRHPLRFLRKVIRTVVAGPRSRPAPAPSRVADASVPLQRRVPRSVAAPDRHTHLALRTARFAGAVRGAQRARSEAAPRLPQIQLHWRSKPRQSRPEHRAQHQHREAGQRRPSPGPAGTFMAGWERQFDLAARQQAWEAPGQAARQASRPSTWRATWQASGGAAWA